MGRPINLETAGCSLLVTPPPCHPYGVLTRPRTPRVGSSRVQESPIKLGEEGEGACCLAGVVIVEFVSGDGGGSWACPLLRCSAPCRSQPRLARAPRSRSTAPSPRWRL